MFEVHPNLFVGSDRDCPFASRGRPATEELAVVHACKSPCHQKAVGYKGNLPPDHAHYLVLERGNDLFLNMIDPAKPLFMPPLFERSLDFIEKHINIRKVLIHCNLGNSMSPSLALLYMAKRPRVISDESYPAAMKDFRSIFPEYEPGLGIQIYLSQNWNQLG
jgi:protein-tyrosine phosphatase